MTTRISHHPQLHIFVMEKKWTFIFSKNYKSWGSFQYDKADDALRVTVNALDAEFQEWLSYDFINREPESAGMELRWAEKKAVVNIRTNVSANIMKDLLAKEEKVVNDFLTLSRLTLEQDPSNAAEAMKWIEQSIAVEETFGLRSHVTLIIGANVLVENSKYRCIRNRFGSLRQSADI